MRNKLWLIVGFFLFGCSNEPDIHPTPLVIGVRFDIPNASPEYIEKYFTQPLIKSLNSTAHITNTHAIAIKNAATINVFFEDEIKFAEGEEIIQKTIKSATLPKKLKSVYFTELCGDDLSDSNLMHIAKTKGIDLEKVLDNVVPVSPDLAKNLLPAEEYNTMFSNECDDPEIENPLYILKN